MKKPGAFLAAIGSDWTGRMSGGGGLLLTILGFFLPAPWQPRAFLGLGVVCFFYASYRAWLAERSRVEELLQRLTPQLDFVHDPRVKPFFEELPKDDGSRLRCLRVGVRNLGTAEIATARVVLEACDPAASPAVHLEHELQPMGKPDGTLTILVPPNGTVFVDVAREVVPAGQQYGTFYLAYAQPLQNDLPPRGDAHYKLTLRAEGGGPSVRCSLELGGRLTWRLDGLQHLPAS